MIRTGIVYLDVIPAAAYRRKLPSGGSGIVILRKDIAQPGIASISKTSGEAIPSANTPLESYPPEAFREAVALTAGLPYKKAGSVTYTAKKASEQKTVVPEPELFVEEAVAESEAYKALVAYYTDKNGRLSYTLLNRDLIKFSNSSKHVRAMRESGADADAIRNYVVASKFKSITGKKDLSDSEIAAMVTLLDEVSPKGVFTELNAELRKKSAR